ncbi:5-(carboxyamino)imidazole ribonucleotide synthase [Canibacter zhoujuaniae]|uniref:5-(carboxyamino)imidazole ribonucleotide synthase n=1 Tax=Canibacter zhoujuaniae TaxID=2708343 RepID=UPI002443F959|nr:5-(carboxyamino)imidazole ribonucleotide synthase [Canibacter zhoujuaniae]
MTTPLNADAPGKIRVGVIGAGQLARMMVPPAIHLGLDISVLAEGPNMSAARAADAEGDYRDLETVREFAKTVDVVTFDHEHVPTAILEALESDGVRVHPTPAALQYAQDKILMRQKLTEIGAPVPEWASVSDPDELTAFIAEHGGRAVVKTARGGYDGKGVRVVSSAAEVADWFAALANTDTEKAENEPGQAAQALLVEELVDFTRELSQLVARRPSGEIAAWEVVETVQRDGVCAEVVSPAVARTANEQTAAAQTAKPSASNSQNTALADTARSIGEQIATGLGVTGVMAVEMFETADGRLLVNELAMRPHNSGHFSIEGSITSQFEQHLRAVTDLPLGSTAATAKVAVMINVLGGPAEGPMPVRYGKALAAFPRAKFHSYGKDPRPGRKVGHVTVTGSDLAETLDYARAAAAVFNN